MPDPRKASLTTVARHQHDLWTLAQALTSGYSRSAIRRRLDGGDWQLVEPRVFRWFRPTSPDARQRLMARTLASRGVASGRSAAALYGWLPFPRVPHVTVQRSARRASSRGIHLSNELTRNDLTVVDDIPCTAPARSLIDLAGVLPVARFEDILDNALLSGAVRAFHLEARARALATPRRRGCSIVLHLLDERHPESRRAANAWEAAVLRMLGRLHTPSPRVNYRVRVGGRTRYLDLAWPEQRVAVELDGFIPHSTRTAFDEDRTRQNDLVAAGWQVFRITKTAISRGGDVAFAPIIATLRRERARN